MESQRKKRSWFILNLANFVTSLRLIFSAFIAVLAIYSEEQKPLLLFILCFLCGISDAFDGWVARKLKTESVTGSLLDKISDKIFICLVVVLLAWPYWPSEGISEFIRLMTQGIVLVVVSLELILFSIGLIAVFKNVNASSNKWGKQKMILQSVAVSAWMLILVVDYYKGTKILYFLIFFIDAVFVAGIFLALKSIEGYWERYNPKGGAR